MTRQLSAHSLKKNTTGGFKNDQGRPTKGTKLREIYDSLRRGETFHYPVVDGVHQTNYAYMISRLRNEYGMELESKRGAGGYIRLIGEWEGPVFVRLEAMLQEDD